MANPAMTDDDCLIALRVFREAGGNTAAAARMVGCSRSTFQNRIENARTRFLDTWSEDDGWTFPRQVDLELPDGVMVVSSDHHYWPSNVPVAHRALVAVCKMVKPSVKILNGDVFDGASVTRHDSFGWARKPNVRQELDACKERLAEIEDALPKACHRIWNVGNHDVRFERMLAAKAAEFQGMEGWRLAEHFHKWDFRWSTLVNPECKRPVMVKHRYNGGVHAGYNNAMKGGLTCVTGHTHLLEAKPWGNWTGRSWGVQTGTVADVNGAQFEYQENNPSAACSGFVVMTFKDGMLLPPELCEVHDGVAYFRGNVVS